MLVLMLMTKFDVLIVILLQLLKVICSKSNIFSSYGDLHNKVDFAYCVVYKQAKHQS